MTNSKQSLSVEEVALVDLILGYGGRCRECADNFGICEGKGLPCNPDEARKAVRFVLDAVSYYKEYPHHVHHRAAVLRSCSPLEDNSR